MSAGAHAQVTGDLRDIVNDLYGGDGITLSQASGFGHDAHFTAESLQGLNNLNDGLASGIGFLSFPSSQSGFELDLETGIPRRVTDSLGPLLADSPTTLGANQISFGFSFTRIQFSHFEGRELDSQQIVLEHLDVNGDGVLAPFQPFPGGPILDFELDQVIIDVNIEIEQSILALFLNYGLTDDFDIGIIIPFVHVDASADATASIFDPTPATPSPHFFDANSDDPNSSTGGSHSGIGDVILRVKHNLTHDALDPLFEMGVAGQIVLPTGDHRNLLGTGETRILAAFLAAKTFDKFTPHLNLGYELVPDNHELNSLRYLLGVDIAMQPEWTVAVDILGRWEHSGDGVGDHLVDIALGTKLMITDDVNFIGNIRVPINRDDGLRSQFVYTVGVEITF